MSMHHVRISISDRAVGLGIAEKDPDSVDWDLVILDHLIPGIKSKDASYSDRDREDESMGRGRMVGDLSDMDWTEWTMGRQRK